MVINCVELHQDIRTSGLTQKQLVEASGISIFTISRITPKKKYMDKTKRVLGAICDVLQTDPAKYIMTEQRMFARLEEISSILQSTTSDKVKSVLQAEQRELESFIAG